MTKAEIIFVAFNLLWLPLSFFLHGYVQSYQTPPDYQCAHPEPVLEPWPEVEDPDPRDDRCRCGRDG